MQVSAGTEARVLVVADWTVDPGASAPCAQRRLDTIAALSRAAGTAGPPCAAAATRGGSGEKLR
jgi:hypothetical protein